MRRALALVLVSLALAGCASEEGAFGFQGATGPMEPYFREYREVIAGQHAKRFDVPVDAPATLVNVTILLDARTNGLALPEVAPARLDVRLLDPAGALIGEAQLDARRPQAELLAGPLEPGLYAVMVEGFGASQDLEGDDYGAGYVVSVEIVYA